jgi:hypothetical protein
MLTPSPTVPHICCGEVRGEDGSVAWLMTHTGIATVDLWACDADRRNMARVVLDEAGVRALVALLGLVRVA